MDSPGTTDPDSRNQVTNDSPELRESPAAALWAAWRAGGEPDLESFVAGLSEVAPRDLEVMIRIDLAARRQRNDHTPAEEYLRRFPAVAADPELALDVIYGEYLARERAGEQPKLAEYQTRFPALAQSLSDQIRLHNALDDALGRRSVRRS
ncbi:MAG TPA: hypothetical protein VG826_05925 [Pirellulales bacterium]|nr:hypothetical protein [Pirellulales bacterium]